MSKPNAKTLRIIYLHRPTFQWSCTLIIYMTKPLTKEKYSHCWTYIIHVSRYDHSCISGLYLMSIEMFFALFVFQFNILLKINQTLIYTITHRLCYEIYTWGGSKNITDIKTTYTPIHPHTHTHTRTHTPYFFFSAGMLSVCNATLHPVYFRKIHHRFKTYYFAAQLHACIAWESKVGKYVLLLNVFNIKSNEVTIQFSYEQLNMYIVIISFNLP